MSADIIERLMSAECYDYGGSGVVVGWLRDDLIDEAVKEIERLRARVEELEYAYSKCLAAVGGVQQDGDPS